MSDFRLFHSTILPKGSNLARYGRTVEANDILMSFQGNTMESIMLTGPRGSGKSAFLEWFCSWEQMKQLAQQNKWLFQRIVLRDDLIRTDAGIFVCLINGVQNAAGLLPEGVREVVQTDLHAEIAKNPGYEANANTAEALLKVCVKVLRGKGYRIVLVIDDFHRLYKKDQNSQDNLQKLASLAQDQQNQETLLSYIAAEDYYPYTQTELGSVNVSPWRRIFQCVEISGLEKPISPKIMRLIEAAQEHQSQIIKRLAEEYEYDEDENRALCWTARIEKEELDVIWTAAGGIPEIIRLTLNGLYDYKVRHNGNSPDEEGLLTLMLDKCKPLFEGWVSRLNENHRITLRTILDNGSGDRLTALPEGVDKSSELKDMKLVYSEDSNYSSKDTVYKVKCPLFAAWLDGELERPQTASPEKEKKEVSQPARGVYIENAVIYQGDHNETHVNISPLTPAVLLAQLRRGEGGLESFGLYLAEALTSRKVQHISAAARLPEQIAWPEHQQMIDDAVNEYSDRLIADVVVDNEAELLIQREELKTLDKSFRIAREDCRKELTDEILSAQSQQCQFYLKMSVVVERALQFTNQFSVMDCSPQMVLYGKAFEQALHDNLFELFHKDQTLSAFDMFSRENNPYSPNAFRNKHTARNASIANYSFLMKHQTAQLSQLCRADKSLKGKDFDEDWWNLLQNDIDQARLIRNRLHPEEQRPINTDIDNLFSFLVGQDRREGILQRLQVGRQIAMDLYHKSKLTLLTANQYLTQSRNREIQIERVMGSGAIRGRTTDEGYLVKLSKKKATDYQARTQTSLCEKMTIPVVLCEYTSQDGEDFFRGDFVE